MKILFILVIFFNVNITYSLNYYNSVVENNYTAKDTNLKIKSEKLIFLANKIKTAELNKDFDNILYYNKLFLTKFPASFSEFIKIYGYEKLKDTTIFGPLYYEDTVKTLKIYFKNPIYYYKKTYIIKLINISKDAYWQADAVNLFQRNLIEKVCTNLELFINILENYSEDDIYGFWHFYFDNPVPEKSLPLNLWGIEKKNNNMYLIIKKALKDIQQEKNNSRTINSK